MLIPFNQTGGFMLQTMLYLANQRPNDSLAKLYDLPPGTNPADINDVKCYGVYGCFPINSPWTSETRPVSLYPESPNKINVKYQLYNCYVLENNLTIFIDINDPDQVNYLNINKDGFIYFVTHGYLEDGDQPWIQKMRNELLLHDKKCTSSVIVIAWGGGSSPPYAQAAANIRLVGAITAHVIHMIYEELNLKNLDKFHIIGHSLGSHLGGYAGYTLQRDFNLHLGRITALDPAEPLFSQTDTIVHLDRTDAKFVDVIHTDAMPFSSDFGLGIAEPIGHLDFYPNGGMRQPGCNSIAGPNSFFHNVQRFLSCNHRRAHELFTESINTKCKFLTISCDNFLHFNNGKCFKCDNNNKCYKFGFGSMQSYKLHNSNGLLRNSDYIKTYFLTDSHSPFCGVNYLIVISISSSEESLMHGGEIGIMSITLHGKNKIKTGKMQFSTEPILFEPESKHRAVISGPDIGTPNYATLHWEYKTNPLNPLTWRIVSSPRVFIDFITIQTLDPTTKIHLCSMFSTPVIAGSANIFRDDYCNYP